MFNSRNQTFNGISNDPAENSSLSLTFTPIHEAISELVPFSLSIILANSLVFLLFLKKTSLRTPSNYLLISLAGCDFFTGFVNIPLTLIVFTQIITYPTLSDLYFLVAVSHNFTAVSTGYHILAITLEKYLAFMHDARHPRSRRAIFRVLSVVWIASVAIAIVPFFWKNKNTPSPKALRLQMAHAIFCLTAVFVLPYIFMIYAYVVMYQAINKARRQRQLEGNCKDHPHNNENRCEVIFIIMGVLYLLCWLPWFSLVLIFTIDTPQEISTKLDTISHVFALVRYSTSVVNPILYTFFKRDFFCAFREIILRKGHREERFFSVLETVRQSNCDAPGFVDKRERGQQNLTD